MTHSQRSPDGWDLDLSCCCIEELDGDSLVGYDDLGDIRCRRCGGLIMENPPTEEVEDDVDLLTVELIARGWSLQRIRWLNKPRTARELFPEAFGPPPRRRRKRKRRHRRKPQDGK